MSQCRVYKIPNQYFDGLTTNDSGQSGNLTHMVMIDRFQSRKEACTLEIMLLKRKNRSSPPCLYFGLRIPGLMEGMNVTAHSRFSLVSSDGDDYPVPSGAQVENGITKWDVDENDHQYDYKLQGIRDHTHLFNGGPIHNENEGQGPFSMGSSSISDWSGICPQGMMILHVQIGSITKTIDEKFYKKMVFEKLFPEYTATELGQLRALKVSLEQAVSTHAQRLKEVQDRLSREVQEKSDLISSLTRNKSSLDRQVADLLIDQKVLQARIAALEAEKANQKVEIHSQEIVKSLEVCDPTRVTFHGSMADKQAIQIKISELMIRLAEDIKSDELCPECKTEKRNEAFKPCGHMCFCHGCYTKKSDSIRLCPLCANTIESAIRITF